MLPILESLFNLIEEQDKNHVGKLSGIGALGLAGVTGHLASKIPTMHDQYNTGRSITTAIKNAATDDGNPIRHAMGNSEIANAVVNDISKWNSEYGQHLGLTGLAALGSGYLAKKAYNRLKNK